MNQILYKGYTFGGVGEDVTNKQYDDVIIHNPITDQDETYTPVGGENAEIFNSYKDKNGQLSSEDIKRNIATGKYSTISGENNKELTEQGEKSQYNTIVGKDNVNINGKGNFIGGISNFVQNGGYCLIYGARNYLIGDYNGIIGNNNKIIGSNSYGGFITGQNNILENSGESFVCGYTNTLENNSAGGLLVGGTTNTITNSYQGIICGQNNKVYGAQSPAVFGQGNIVGDSENPSYTSIAASGMVSGRNNQVGLIDSGVHVLGTSNKVKNCDNGTLVCGDSNIVSNTNNGAIIGGSGNTVLEYSEGIVAGEGNNVRGRDNIICGRSITSKSSQSFICGNGGTVEIDSSIVGLYGGTIKGGYGSIIFSRSNSIADSINRSLAIIDNTKVRNILNSTVNIKDFDLGYAANYLGLTTEYEFNHSDTLDIVTGFSVAQWTPDNSYDYDNKTFTTDCYIQEVTFVSVDIGNDLYSYELIPKKYYYWTGGFWKEADYETVSTMRFIGYTPYSIQSANVDLVNDYTFGTTISKASASNYDCLQTLSTGTSTGILQSTYLYNNDNWDYVTEVPRLSDIINSLVIGNNGSLTRDTIKSIILGDENTSVKTEKSIIIGNSNTIQSGTINSIIIGLNNSMQLIESIILGKDNTVIENSNNGICLGNSNTIRSGSSNNCCIGDLNSIEQGTNNTFVFGKSNSLSSGAFKNLCLGNSNKLLSSSHVICIGDDNDCEQGSSYNRIFGESNTLNQSSSYNFIIGNNSLATGSNQNSFIIGYSNTAMNGGNQNYIYGYNNVIANGAQNIILLGLGLKNSNASNNSIIGRYNIDPNNVNNAGSFIVGNGTSDNDRSNALEIKADGSQVITLKDTTVTGLGIGKITITQSNISFESLKENSNQEKETVSFTFEEIQALKNGGGSGPVPAQLEARVSALETTVGNSSSGLVYDVDNLETIVGDSSSGLVEQVNTIDTSVSTVISDISSISTSISSIASDVSAISVIVGDSSSGIVQSVNTLNTTIYTSSTGLVDRVEALEQGGGGSVDPQIVARVSALETTVGDSSSGLVYDVDNLLQLANLDEESYPISFYNGDQTVTIDTTVTTE